ncbi:hypothetical protein [Stygiolobus caldivivus]|uniref:Uncharacterized protein n=1 Tax=Stygiolobus caldivivus TaxID=2824673 RepID=A0A8D5U6K5_9CREN|nr:hypothetical protein [Stygiolobus caldivivus]BCU70481.1 hypothetical protein KN1_17780 [Stygiolobus caldivivus]
MSQEQQELEEISTQNADYNYAIYRNFIEKNNQANNETIGQFEGEYTNAVAGGREGVPEEYLKNAKCQVLGNRRAYRDNMFWLYPAIIVPERMRSDTTSLVEIIRQGVLIKSNEEGLMWFIGGCDPSHWRSGKYYVFQGGAQFGYFKSDLTVGGGTRITAEALNQYAASLNENSMQVCIIPVLAKSGLYGTWKDPVYYSLGGDINYEKSVDQLVLPSATPQLLTYQPALNYLAIYKISDFKYTKERHTYISKSVLNYLLDLSSKFPYLYPGYYGAGAAIQGYPNQLFLGYMRVVVANFPKGSPFYKKSEGSLLYPEFYDSFVSSNFMLNSMSVGAPVYLSKDNPSDSDMCTDYGVLGLVSGIMSFATGADGQVFYNDRSLLLQPPPKDFEWGFYILSIMKVPSVSDIDNFIDGLKQKDAVSIVLGSVRSAKRAISSLITSGVLAGIAFSAVMAVEEWGDEQEIVGNAGSYVEKLNKVYNEALNFASSCIESQPNLTRNEKIIYVQQVQDYLNGLMYSLNAREGEEEILSFLEYELGKYLKDQGITCMEY